MDQLSRPSRAPELLVRLDRTGPETLSAQLERRLREAVRDGRLKVGTVLPSTRALAADLGISRGLVVGAYAQLGAEGYLALRRGRRPASRRSRSRPRSQPLRATRCRASTCALICPTSPASRATSG